MKIYKVLAGACDFSYLFVFSCHPPAATNVVLTTQLVLWGGCIAFSKATANLSLLIAHLGIRMFRRVGRDSPHSSLWLDHMPQLCVLTAFYKAHVALVTEALKLCLISRAAWVSGCLQVAVRTSGVTVRTPHCNPCHGAHA